MGSSFVCQRFARALFALSRGLYTTDDVRERTRRYWDARDEFQSEAHVLSGLFDWEKPVFDRHLAPNGRVGIIGCGAGRDVLALSHAGQQVVGLDSSPECVALARSFIARSGCVAEVHCADAADFRFPEPSYDTFVFSWFTYCCIVGSHRRIQILNRLRQQLRTPGKVIISLPYYRTREDKASQTNTDYAPPKAHEVPQLAFRFPSNSAQHVTDLTIRFSRNRSPLGADDSILTLTNDARGGVVSHLHWFSSEELCDEVRAAGFTITDSLGLEPVVVVLESTIG